MRRLAISCFVVGAHLLSVLSVGVAADPTSQPQPPKDSKTSDKRNAEQQPEPNQKPEESEPAAESDLVESEDRAADTEPLPSDDDLFVDDEATLGDDLGLGNLGGEDASDQDQGVALELAEIPISRLVQWQLRLESGGGFDTNVFRTERIGPSSRISSSPQLSLGIQADASVRRPRWLAMVRAGGSAMLFGDPDAQAENVGIAKLDTQVWRVLGSRGAQLGLRGGFFNASALNPNDEIEDQLGRNFLTANGELVASLPGPGPDRVVAALGYRSFVYKPNDDFNWQGQSAQMTYRRTFWSGDESVDDHFAVGEELDGPKTGATIDASATYSLGLRGYQGPSISNVCAPSAPISPLCFMATTARRRDLNHSLAVSVVYTGARIYSARYGVRLNDSNSFGQSLVRQRLELAVTTEIFRTGVFATAELVVLVNHFLDPLLLARDAADENFDSLEDENRNALSLHASKEVRPRLSVEGRYALFTNEFGSQDRPFRRQTFFGGLVYEFQ